MALMSMKAFASILILQVVFLSFCNARPQDDGPGLQEGDPETVAGAGANNDPLIDYQTQIYIVSGTLGGILLLLILLVIALALSVAKLKDQVNKKHQRYIVPDDQNANTQSPKRGGEAVLAYDNSAFNGHEMQERRVDAKQDIEQRGYTIYNGRSNENRYPSNNRDSRSTLMRYEDGVVPITSDSRQPQVHRNNNRDYRY